MLVTTGAVCPHTTSGAAARTRRRVGAAGASGLGAAVAVACGVGGGASGGAAGGSAPSLQTGVTLRMMQYGTQPEIITKQEVLRRFEAEHPGLKAELDNGSAGYADKLAAATAGGSPPDVFWFDPALFLEYARRGFLLDLAPLIRRDKYDLADFYERALAQYEWQGKRYGMPKDFPARGLYFNQNAFQDNGIALPAATYADAGWTWDRFLDAAQRLTRERNGDANYGWTMGTGFREWMVWVYANGGEFVNKDATECLLHEPPAVDALQLLQDVRTRYRFMPQPADVQAGATFALGRVAMIESGPFNIGNLRREAKDFTWDAGPMPRPGPAGAAEVRRHGRRRRPGDRAGVQAPGGGLGAAQARDEPRIDHDGDRAGAPQHARPQVAGEQQGVPRLRPAAEEHQGVRGRAERAARRPADDELGGAQCGDGARDRAAVVGREVGARRGRLHQAGGGPAAGAGGSEAAALGQAKDGSDGAELRTLAGADGVGAGGAGPGRGADLRRLSRLGARRPTARGLRAARGALRLAVLRAPPGGGQRPVRADCPERFGMAASAA